MKKLMMIVGITLVVLFTSIATPAQAAWGGWSTSDKGVTARVYVDAYTYTTKATTVDFKAEKKGSKKYYYKAVIYKSTSSQIIPTATFTGSFTSSSPLKKAKLYELRKHGSGVYFVRFKLYSKSNYTGLVGLYDSHNFTITAGA